MDARSEATSVEAEREPQEDPVLLATPDNPVPEKHVAGHIRARDGKKLRYAIFKCDAPVARGTIVLLHGRNEFIEKYFETIRHFTDRGMWVATFDWRGQGGSDRLVDALRRGHLRRFSDFEDDLNRFLEEIVLPEARLPFTLVAHSMGALVALKAAPRLTNRIERMVLLAPFVDLAGRRFSRSAIHLLCRIMGIIGLGRVSFESDRFPRPFEGNVLTHDSARFARNQRIYESWPRLRLGPPTADWIRAMLSTMNRVAQVTHLNAIRIPTLIIAAGADTIVETTSIERVANRFRAAQMITVDRARHELLQEIDRFRLPTLAAIDAFLLPEESLTPENLTVGIAGEPVPASAGADVDPESPATAEGISERA